MFKPMFRAALAASLLVLIAACDNQQAQDQAAAPAKTPIAAPAAAPVVASTPDAAIRKSVELLKQGDIAGMLQNAMPPAIFAQFKADLTNKDKDNPITDDDRQKFAQMMTELTAPDADQQLYAKIEPQLKQFDAQYQQQLPMYVAMFTSLVQGKVQENKDLSDMDKQQVMAAVNALGAWAQKTRFTDPDSIRKVLAIVVKAARDMNIKTLDEARALNFDQSMQKARIGYLALRNALNVYGFSIDQVLDSVKPEVVSNDGKAAKVKVSYTLLGAPLSINASEMVNIDGHWYGKDAADAYRKAMTGTQAAPAAAPANVSATAPMADPAATKKE